MKIRKIKDENYEAYINLSRGANCIRLYNEKYDSEILRVPNYENMDNPFLYGMPILFPVNRIQNGEFVFEGRKYTFPINEIETGCHLHGFLHTAEFNVEEHGENYIKCVYESDELYNFFPHQFKIEIMYSLSENGLLQETCVHNLSSENMPVFLGFHTTFNVPFVKSGEAENIRIFAEVGDVIERNMATYLPTGRIIADDVSNLMNVGEFKTYGNEISKHYKAKKSGNIKIRDISNNLCVCYENDKKFGWRLFYNGDADKFICLEPQTCMVNCQNVEGDRKNVGFTYIKPNECETYISRIYVKQT